METFNMKLKAIYKYTAERSEEMNIEPNQNLKLLYRENSWLKVENNLGESGFVPLNYVEFQKTKVKAKFRFIARDISELTISPNEILLVINQEGEEWLRVENQNNEKGMVPVRYVEEIPSWDYYRETAVGEFAGRDWYYGSLSREQAIACLGEGDVGDFLIRDRGQDGYSISILSSSRKVIHLKIYRGPLGRVTIGDERQETFESIHNLISNFAVDYIHEDRKTKEKTFLVKAFGAKN
ncbi:DgyrCDS2138 [Dimorphilus gyrociliatus]|uniref:DgyrCDS2138 n=1 Tax=Dimorphilus gyrociliatus TaxID=2664684 RepID=A0A7I8VEG9_9ANNE|nr:DgyrCDS2138 [Dimorphilus gyrociliatus]